MQPRIASRQNRSKSKISRETIRAVREARSMNNLIAGHAAQVVAASKGLELTKQSIIAAIEAFFKCSPPQDGTQVMVAIHEAAHFVAFEVLGSRAYDATIRGSLFGRSGWCGKARQIDVVDVQRANSDELLKEGISYLTGLFAEQILGGGHALSSVGELLAARIYVHRATMMTGENSDDHWKQTLTNAEALVRQNSDQILKIAQVLINSRRVTYNTPSVKKVLATIKPLSHCNFQIPLNNQILINQFYSIVPNLLAQSKS